MRPEPGIHNAASHGIIPYLVLLREGFTYAAPLSLSARRALTPPFHPYLPAETDRRYLFCCTGLPAEYRPRYPSFQRDSLLYAVRTFLDGARLLSPRRDCPRLTRLQGHNITAPLKYAREEPLIFSGSVRPLPAPGRSPRPGAAGARGTKHPGACRGRRAASGRCTPRLRGSVRSA